MSLFTKRPGPWLLRLALISVTIHSIQGADSPPAAGRDPGVQGERDWVDSRWSRADVGQFLASNLEIPGARIAKALSIKVGDHDQGTICFDTGQCAWRAGWIGGFLQFDPARFGLIQSPRIAGKVVFSSPSSVGWESSSNRYLGLHLHGQRVVLEYLAGEMRVLDSPWLESVGQQVIFTRSLELGPSRREAGLVLSAAGAEDRTAPSPSGHARALIRSGTNFLAVEAVGTNATLVQQNGKLILRVPPHDALDRIKLLLAPGDETPWLKFDEAAAQTETENLAAWLEPGPPRWLPELKTMGQRGLETDFLAVDTLTLPYDNPWKALMFLAGVDFTPDGAAYVCAIHGDVWRVTGINDNLRELHWKRFATGLFQPLGLKVRDGQVYVLGRDQITRLHDLNGDGEADFYENFCNLIATAEGHNYVTSLEKDDAGNFYYTDPRGVHRVDPDGRRLETLATGFRNPNGLGVSPDGAIISVAPQQGEWTPSSELCEIKPGAYYGYGGPRLTPARSLGYDPALCWIPHAVDNSGGSQVWVPPGRWGPLGGQMLHLLWGRCGLMLVLRDVVGGIPQAAVVPLPARFLSGPQRGSFNPRDGHLYVAGSTGWQTSAVKDGALQRVRFTGKPVYLPVGWSAQGNGLTLKFAEPLERAAAEDPGSYSIHQWNYRYAASYGSKDWSVTNPETEGRDEVAIKGARLLEDGKTLFLSIPDLQPVMQMEIQYSLMAASGKALRNQLWLTLNRL